MTRINFGIPPEHLTDQHLLAEFRELPRIPRAVKKNVSLGKLVKTIEGQFRLGTGHVTFFNDKLEYLHDRYNSLFLECQRRTFEVQFDNSLFDLSQTREYYRDAMCSDESIEIIKERIATRVLESKQIPRYYGKVIDKNEYVINVLEK